MPKISLSNTDRHHERFDFSVIANLKIVVLVVLIEKILAWEIQIEQLFVTRYPFLLHHITYEDWHYLYPTSRCPTSVGLPYMSFALHKFFSLHAHFLARIVKIITI